MNKRIGITCLIILLSACLLSAIIVAGGVGVYMWGQAHPMPTVTSALGSNMNLEPTSCPGSSCTPMTTPDTSGASASTSTPYPAAELPKYITKIMDQIQAEVIGIRGLTSTAQVPRALLSSSELENKVVNDFLADYSSEEAHTDGLTLSLMGLLPDQFDLLAFYKDLYSEQIAGFYDDEAKEMYVVRGSGFTGTEKMTYAHEYTHVLQDQNFDMHNGLRLNDEACQKDSEHCAAVTALIEGDASLTEYTWLYNFASEQDRSDIQNFYQTFSSPVYDSAPAYMQKDFLFPYQYGQEFVQYIYDRGGWPAVNNVYANPPVSTEQIMHPERYPADIPVKINLPDISSALGEGWKQLENDVVGEWYTFLILSQGNIPGERLDPAVAGEAAKGWGGDAYQVYENPATHQSVLIIDALWDTDRDAREFYQAFRDVGDARWGSPQNAKVNSTNWQTDTLAVRISYDANHTLVVLAPDPITVELVLNLLQVK